MLKMRKSNPNVCCPLMCQQGGIPFISCLDCALKFVRGFYRLEEEDGHYKLYFCEADGNGKKSIGPPNYLDWENVKTFVKFLCIFYDVTLRFSGSLFVTSNTYFHELISIKDQLQQLCNVDGDPLLKSMAVEMKKKYMINIGEVWIISI